jgi:polyphosphate kinase
VAGGHFLEQIFPVLTPLSIDPAHPFPFIPNLGFTIALQLRHRRDGKPMNALLRLPRGKLKPLHPPAGPARATSASSRSERRGLFIGKLFPAIRSRAGHVPHHPRQRHRGRGRGRRSGALFETALKRRRRGSVIRIEFDSQMPSRIARLRGGAELPWRTRCRGRGLAGAERFRSCLRSTGRSEIRAL